MAAMAGGQGAGGNSPRSPPPPPVSMAPAPGLPGMLGNAVADQAQALQTFAQLQSLFLPNPAAAAQMMNMQQLQALAQLQKGGSPLPLPTSLAGRPHTIQKNSHRPLLVTITVFRHNKGYLLPQ